MFVSYCGSRYYGFQKQSNGPTIQETLELTLTRIFKEEIKIFTSSRTDRGVHAYKNAVIFDLSYEIVTETSLSGINRSLPEDIRAFDLQKVDDFYAVRKLVTMKIYKYVITLSKPSVFDVYLKGYYPDIDIKKMEEASKLLIGVHNFSGFTTSDSKSDPNKEIIDIKFVKDNDNLEIYFKGKSFLKYMVRKMVGLLVEIGLNKKNKSIINDIFLTNDKSLIGVTAAPGGLYLVDVIY
jgi:tRNA pseudouridine38-40 synthase